jgi:hypothetical protein
MNNVLGFFFVKVLCVFCLLLRVKGGIKEGLNYLGKCVALFSLEAEKTRGEVSRGGRG